MPFAKGARIEIENQTDITIKAFYYYIDYLEVKELPNDMGRFHAWFNREITETLPEGETEWNSVGKQRANKDGSDNYVFADIKGKGHFVGLNYYVQCPTPCGTARVMTCGSLTANSRLPCWVQVRKTSSTPPGARKSLTSTFISAIHA